MGEDLTIPWDHVDFLPSLCNLLLILLELFIIQIPELPQPLEFSHKFFSLLCHILLFKALFILWQLSLVHHHLYRLSSLLH